MGKVMAQKTESAATLNSLASDNRFLREVFAAKGICAGCGACVTVCQILGNKVLKYDAVKGSLALDISEEECRQCGLCYAVCPRKNYLGNAAHKPIETENYIGNVRRFEILRAKDPEIRQHTGDSGFILGFLKSLMDMNYIDGAIVSTLQQNWAVNQKVTHSSDELLHALGTKYAISPSIVYIEKMRGEQLPHQYPGYNDKRYALIGQPCMITAISNMRKYNLEVARKIRLTIGLFCFESLNYTEITSKLESKTGTKIESWERVDQKGAFLVRVKGQQTPLEVPFKDLGGLVRESCHVCLDLTNLDADIAAGSMGAPQGYSSVIIRTKAGEEAMMVAMRGKLLEGIPEIGTNAKIVYDKALKTITGVAKKKCCTVNLARWEELTKK